MAANGMSKMETGIGTIIFTALSIAIVLSPAAILKLFTAIKNIFVIKEEYFMKRVIAILLSVFFVLTLHALDNEVEAVEAVSFNDSDSGFFISGGVKTGLLIRNRNFNNDLGKIAGIEDNYPMTLHFASYENNSRNGEGWLNIGYRWNIYQIGKFGLQIGLWAHGDIHSFDDAIKMGDHFLWANFADDRLRFIGGQGGGTPITSGGWINADWLSYTGLRFFWIDPSGLSVGLILPDPGENGIVPVNYLATLGAGVSFKYESWWISGQVKNAPIYDDSESNYYGGLHRPDEQDPIAMAGNIAIGMGVENLYFGRGFLTLEALITNLGEDEIEGLGDYTFSPVVTTFAFQTGASITDSIYVEFKGKYTISKGDNMDFSKAINWGKLEYEPYISFKPFEHLIFHLSFYGAHYFNSSYLALTPSTTMYSFNAGQVPIYIPIQRYLSPFQFSIKPKITFILAGVDLDFGYDGSFSKDHVDNKVYIDFRWRF
jgi:hypothetical protein